MKAFALVVLAVASASAHAEVVDQRSKDITVLKASNTEKALGGYGAKIDFNQCSHLFSDDTFARMDCTSVIENAITANYPEVQAPLINQVLLNGTRNAEGDWNVSQYSCQALEIQTVSRRDALKVATGIGFYFDDSVRTVPVSQLVKIGEATLKDGTAVDIHRFLASAFCWRGTISNSSLATYAFRPYMEFGTEEGRIYRNWDIVDRDYLLGHVYGNQVMSFDRTSELLK